MSLQPREYTGHQQIGGQKKKIHIFYIKKITDLTNVFEDKKNFQGPLEDGKDDI